MKRRFKFYMERNLTFGLRMKEMLYQRKDKQEIIMLCSSAEQLENFFYQKSHLTQEKAKKIERKSRFGIAIIL